MINYRPMEERPDLYIIPIAHTYADAGSLRDEIPVDEIYEARVTGYWVEIFRCLKRLPPNLFAGLQIYQDSLPNISPETVDRIVDETQTANYEILRWLREKGAVVLGTENPNLLMEEDRALKAIINCPDGRLKTAARFEYLRRSILLLEERDRSIARRIKETLLPGKTGLLLIGAAHDVGSFLTDKIRVSTPEMVSRALPEVLRSLRGLGKERRGIISSSINHNS